MATNLRNALNSGLGSTPTTITTTIPNGKTTVIGLSLTNLLEIPVLASIQLDDGTVSAYFLKNVVIPPNQSLRVINGGEKLVLGVSTDVIITASEDASLDLVMSYVEIV
jgi:hypothetical protein